MTLLPSGVIGLSNLARLAGNALVVWTEYHPSVTRRHICGTRSWLAADGTPPAPVPIAAAPVEQVRTAVCRTVRS
jgi:hypothetical protein